MIKLLVTGITGFVGTNLVRYLSDDKRFEIYGLIRPESDLSHLENLPVKGFFTVEELEKCPADMVVHALGKAHDLKKTSARLDYYHVNYHLTQEIVDWYNLSGGKKFIYISSIKAVTDAAPELLNEEVEMHPGTVYGRSKQEAEGYVEAMAEGQYYILRPCIIHGPGNQGNLKLLYNFIRKGIPYPLGAFQNRRSFLSVDNLSFVIRELLTRDIPSGIYNVADDEPLATREVVKILGQSLEKKSMVWNFPRPMMRTLAGMGDYFGLPLNQERFSKLTENYVLDIQKLKAALGKPLPLSSRTGLEKTFREFVKVKPPVREKPTAKKKPEKPAKIR